MAYVIFSICFSTNLVFIITLSSAFCTVFSAPHFIKLIYYSSTSDDSFVKMPVSKFFLCPLFIPIPAHVKFAEPMYAVSMSNISA